jgi:hypothetical protein
LKAEQVTKMKSNHIIEIIDTVSVANLSQSELDAVMAHASECASCESAFEAAQLTALAIKERAQVTIEPSPFFQTRVLAAWREQQTVDTVPAFLRLWNSARALVSAMAVATIALAVVSFISPEQATAVPEQTALADSAYSVILDQADEQLSYEQVLSAIYEEEGEAK